LDASDVHLLGTLEALLPSGLALVLPTRKAPVLLACLALHPGQTHQRTDRAPAGLRRKR